MSKRLYFDCPIIALYMMREFGVQIIIYEDGQEILLSDFTFEGSRLYDIIDELDIHKYYVAKESEQIFEPKEGDLAVDLENDWNIGTYDAEYKHWRVPYEYPFEQGIIIMRDNKQFFMPKEEV